MKLLLIVQLHLRNIKKRENLYAELLHLAVNEWTKIYFFREIICVNHKKMRFGQVQCENYELLTKFREINFPTKLSKCKLVSRFFPNMSNKFVKLQTSHQTKNSSLCKWFHEKSLSIKVSSFTNELKVVI